MAGAHSESVGVRETLKGFKQDVRSTWASHLKEHGVEGSEEEMSHRRADLASAICKEPSVKIHSFLPRCVLFPSKQRHVSSHNRALCNSTVLTCFF